MALRGLQDAVFGPGMLSFTLIVWTHADLLDGSGLEEYLQDADDGLKSLIASARGGNVMFDNRMSRVRPSPPGIEPQVEELLLKAAGLARPLPSNRREGQRVAGRRSNRRKRQIEAGMLRQKSHVETVQSR